MNILVSKCLLKNVSILLSIHYIKQNMTKTMFILAAGEMVLYFPFYFRLKQAEPELCSLTYQGHPSETRNGGCHFVPS